MSRQTIIEALRDQAGLTTYEESSFWNRMAADTQRIARQLETIEDDGLDLVEACALLV